jgi:hypothetical protein
VRIRRLLFLLSVFSTLTYAQRGGMPGVGSDFRGAGFAGGAGFRGGFVGGGFRSRFVSPGFQANFRFVNRPFFFPGNRFFFGVGFGFPFSTYGYPSYGSCDCDPYYYNCLGHYGSTAYAPDYAPTVAEKPALTTAVVPATLNSAVPSADQASRVQPVSAMSNYSFHQGADYYLIAFTNQTIKAASSFIVRVDRIKWVPREGRAAETAPLATVDRRFREQINSNRQVKFPTPNSQDVIQALLR